MKRTNKRQQDITNKAARIFELIKANRDKDAEAELHGFAADSVNVACALLIDEGRITPTMKFRSRIGRFTLLSLPILFSFLMFKLNGAPSNDAALWHWWYVSLAVGGYGVEFYVGCWIWGKAYEQESKNPLMQPDYRTNEIACRFIADNTSKGQELLEGLLLAGNAVPRPSEETRHDVDTALLNMLESLDREELLELNDNIRNSLCLRFHQIANSPPLNLPNTWSGSCIPTRDPLNIDHALVGTAILNMLDDIDGLVMLDNARRLAGVSSNILPEEWQRLSETAKQVLPVLETRFQILRSGSGRELLRASDAGPIASEDLLRPQPENQETNTAELVRASSELDSL